MNDAKTVKTQLCTASTDQKSALQDKRSGDCQTAVTEFNQAEQGVPEKETKNHALVWGNLGAADECAGKYGDPARSFQKAPGLLPTAGYYTGLANNDANLGAPPTDPKESAAKFTDANAACD